MSGLAADFVIYGYGTPYEICLKLQSLPRAELTIDQLIWEYGDWVHLAIAPPGDRTRLPMPDHQQSAGTTNGFA